MNLLTAITKRKQQYKVKKSDTGITRIRIRIKDPFETKRISMAESSFDGLENKFTVIPLPYFERVSGISSVPTNTKLSHSGIVLWF